MAASSASRLSWEAREPRSWRSAAATSCDVASPLDSIQRGDSVRVSAPTTMASAGTPLMPSMARQPPASPMKAAPHR